MKTILLINASPFGAASRNYKLARKAADNLLDARPDIMLVERHLAAARQSPIAEDYADAIVKHAERDAPAFAESEILIREVEACDYLIVATPTHNFSVPAALKLWIDYVLRADRTFTYRDGYKIGMLDDRPTLVVVSSGGVHNGPNARQPDYLSPYLTEILATIGISDVQIIRLQGLAIPDFAAESLALGDRLLAANPIFGLTSVITGS